MSSADREIERIGKKAAEAVEGVIADVAKKHAGESATSVLRRLETGLKRIGVEPNKKELKPIAEEISKS